MGGSIVRIDVSKGAKHTVRRNYSHTVQNIHQSIGVYEVITLLSLIVTLLSHYYHVIVYCHVTITLLSRYYHVILTA